MNYLKNHLSLILALISILFSIEVYFIFNKIVTNYSQKIANNYNIIVVSNKPINNLKLHNISKIEPINIENSLQNLKQNLQGFDIKKLKSELPYFYKLHFYKFPTPTEIEELTIQLKKIPFIKKIETFRANQNRIYNLLILTKTISIIFMNIILFISFLLILKQMEVWKLEHSERMYIMDLFGAPFLLKSGVLLRLTIIDSIISVIIIGIIITFISHSNLYQNILNQLGITININIIKDLALFLAISIVVSIISTIIVILSKKSEN
jgi:cell division transport system permease protein